MDTYVFHFGSFVRPLHYLSFPSIQFVSVLFYLFFSLRRNRDYDRRIYHLVSSAEIKVSWEQLIDCGRWIICNRLPLNGVLWYPGGSMKSSRLHHNICCILYHWIPAILLDCLLFCLRYPPVYVFPNGIYSSSSSSWIHSTPIDGHRSHLMCRIKKKLTEMY